MLPPPTSLLLFLLAALALNITPGPDMLYVLARSADQGRGAGIVSALGIAGGCLIQTCLVALGLSSILTTVPLAYELIKDVGALYLVYLGIRTLVSRKSQLAEPVIEQTGRWRIFFQGVMTNVLNPKVALFYLAFLPQFVDATRGNAAVQIFLLGILFNISGTTVNIIVAYLASMIGKWLKSNAQAAKIIHWITGGIFIALGIRLVFLKRQ